MDILRCPIIDFLKDYGPVEVGSDEVASCKQFLLAEELLESYSEGYRWKQYSNESSALARGEIDILGNMKVIVDSVFKYAATTVRGRGNEYTFQMFPNKHPDDECDDGHSSMNASVVEPGYTGSKLPYRSSVVHMEFTTRRSRNDQARVRQQIVRDCWSIMCKDPRRMFIFAITIEGTQMGTWYFSRTHSIKALSFDWRDKDMDQFIHVFLAFAFSTPKDLGVDPLVHKAPADPADADQHYIYECPTVVASPVDDANQQAPKSKYFKTVHAIYDQSPHSILGRTTRVWKVIEVDSPGLATPISTEPVVLKDVWLDIGNATEADNQDSVFEAIEKLISDAKDAWGEDWMARLVSEDRRFASFDQTTKARLQRLLSDGNYRSLFLTKLHAWKGEVSKPLSRAVRNGVQSSSTANSRNLGLHTRMSSTKVGSLYYSSGVNEDDSGDDGDEDSGLAVKAQRIKAHYAPKQQSRFVYKEICSQLYEVGNLGAFMDLILQATEALLIMFCSGWVHRDISSGNLLAFKDNGSWKIKLSDLEFSEQLGHTGHRAGPKIGTPFFMPYEIMSGRHLVDQIRGERRPDMGLAKQVNILGDKTSPLYPRLSIFKSIPGGERVTAVPDTATSDIPKYHDNIKYNFQHDLEAIWWIVVYFITACVPYRRSRNYGKSVFPKSFTIRSRRLTCFRDPFSVEVGQHLQPIVAEAFITPMEDLRIYMIEQYMAREVFGQIDVHESYSMIHNDFATILTELLENEDDGWKQIPIIPSSALTGIISHPLKRGRGNSDAQITNLNKKTRNDELD